LEGLTFNPNPYAGDTPSSGIRVNFSLAAIGEWKFDPTLKRYVRFSEDEGGKLVPLTDRMTKQQLAVDNLMVLFVPWTRCFVAGLDSKGNQAIVDNELWEFNLANTGSGYFFRDGTVRPGLWKNAGANTPLRFLSKDGQPYMLNPGTTYIAVIPTNSPWGLLAGASASTGPEWQFSGNPSVRIPNENNELKAIVPNDTRPC
jgi:hypothetical protein